MIVNKGRAILIIGMLCMVNSTIPFWSTIKRCFHCFPVETAADDCDDMLVSLSTKDELEQASRIAKKAEFTRAVRLLEAYYASTINDQKVLLVRDHKTTKGFIIYHPDVGVDSSDIKSYYVEFLVIAKKYREKGRGKALMRAVIEEAIDQKASYISLRSSEKACKFYERLGFQKVLAFDTEYIYRIDENE